jgi:hypothetical protein
MALCAEPAGVEQNVAWNGHSIDRATNIDVGEVEGFPVEGYKTLRPDLTDIGMLRRTVELRRSVIDPDVEVLAPNRYYRVVLKDGKAVTGRLLNEDTFSLQMLDMNETGTKITTKLNVVAITAKPISAVAARAASGRGRH